MIVGDDWKSDEIKRLLESIEPHFHGLVVNWNGTERKPRWGSWTSLPITYIQSKWEDDFGAARNMAYKAIPRDDYGWWMWIDSDDVFHAPDGFEPVWETKDEYTQGFFMRYDYGVDPRTGRVVVEQWRERLMNLDWVWQWKWTIHEVCGAPAGTAFERLDGPDTGKIYIEHHRYVGEDRGARERNRRIIMKALRAEPEEARYIYYFANECLAEAASMEPGPDRDNVCDAGILQYQKFLNAEGAGSGDDAYGAACRIGELFAMKTDWTGAVDAFLQAAKYYPHWPEAWIGCAKSLINLGDFERVHAFASIAKSLPRPKTSAAVEPLNYEFTPTVLIALALEAKGDLEGALKEFKAARKIHDDPDPKHNLHGKIAELTQKIKEAEKVKKETPWEQRKRTRGAMAEKSIAFYTDPISEEWNQKTLRSGGHGGAETLVLELAPRFAADGWRVAVFGRPGDERGISSDGVEYWNSEDFMPMEPFTVFVSSRSPQPFAGPLNAQKSFLWLHDVNNGPAIRQIADRPDQIIPISPWHKEHTQKLYGIPDDRLTIIPNGVDLSMYPEPEFTDGHRFFWSSSPDRGLDNLLALWPEIRRRWDDATLEVYYGFDFIDKLVAGRGGNSGLLHLKMQVEHQLYNLGGEEGGIIWKGRVPPAQLAEAQQRADIWAYPTQFMETFCLTAIQAQLCGAIPLASRLAALDTAVACPWLMIDGWAGNSDYQSRYLYLLDTVFADTSQAADLRAQARRTGREHAEKFSIENAYAKWNELFTRHGVKVT